MSESITYVCVDGELVPDWMVGFTEAVRLTGKSRSTIDRDTKTGKLPSVGEPGARKYKVSDLQEKYGLKAEETQVQESQVAGLPFNPADVLSTALQPLIAFSERQAEAETINTMELKRIRQALETLIALQTETSKPKPWWKRWFS